MAAPASNTQRLQRVLELCAAVLDQPGAERMTYLSRACDGDFRLRASVESVLVALKDARQFMDVADIRADNFADYVGDEAGDYRLDSLLGISPLGGMYLARRDDDSPVAVRVVRGHLWARELIERFSDELAIFARVRDPAIASLLDGGVTASGSPYLVYEYVEGLALDQHCDQQRLGVRDRLKLMREVCRGTHVGHMHLAAWRSLRPSNVLVDASGQPKLLDFGLATLMHRQHGPVRLRDSTLLSMWLSQFAAPEAFDDGVLSVRADVYSLGAMTYELLCGQRRPPVALEDDDDEGVVRKASEQVLANEDDALREAIAHRRQTTTAALAKDLAGPVDALIETATRPAPEKRFDSASAMARAIQRLLDGRPLPTDARGVVEAEADDVPEPMTGSSFWQGVLVGAAVAALAAVLWTAGQR